MTLKHRVVLFLFYSFFTYASNFPCNEPIKGYTNLTISNYYHDTLRVKISSVFDSLGRESKVTTYYLINSVSKTTLNKYIGNCLTQSVTIGPSHDTIVTQYEYGSDGVTVSILTAVNGKKSEKETIEKNKHRKLEYFENPIIGQETWYDSNGNSIRELIQGDGNSITRLIYNECDASKLLLKSTCIACEASEARLFTLLSTTSYKYQKGKVVEEKTIASDDKVITYKKYYYDNFNRISRIEYAKEPGQKYDVYKTSVYQYK